MLHISLGLIIYRGLVALLAISGRAARRHLVQLAHPAAAAVVVVVVVVAIIVIVAAH